MTALTERRELAAIRQEKVRTMTRQGHSLKTIAEHLGTTKRTIARDRTTLGISQPGPRKISPEQWAHVEQLLNDGCSYQETSRTTGINASHIATNYPGRGWNTAEASSFAIFVAKTLRHTPRPTQRKDAA